jgi:pyruvate dehydrogenase E1 component alpha subunit
MKQIIQEPKDWYLSLLRSLVVIRRFEEEAMEQYDKGNIRGTLHVCVGQEAVAVGGCEPKQAGDKVTSGHRGHGHFIAAGGSTDLIMAELFGRRDGYCRGRGGTQHMACVDVGFLGSNGITGGGIPYATGMALAMKMRGQGNVVICFFGDGAINQGVFHESLNMASIWKLPIVYVCENNQYAMGSRITDMVAVANLSDRAAGYGMRGVSVDGNDVLAVVAVMREAVGQARVGDGPVLIEAMTYRLLGHSRNDKCQYRTREEEQQWAKRCPINRLKDYMMSNHLLTDLEWEGLKREVDQKVEEAVAFAHKSACLDGDEARAGVFC